MSETERAVWLAFEPRYKGFRGRATRVGAHAFIPGAARSLCEFAPRVAALGPADDEARPCRNCQRVVARLQLARTSQLGESPTAPDFRYEWRVSARLPERKGQRCAVLARGAMNSCLVVFEDGYHVITSRNYLRRAAAEAA